METVLYVFSATGNCLTTARILARELGDTRILPVAEAVKNRKVKESAQAVGFVFPVYYGDMPWPVRELIGKMVFEGDPYIFACTTCRGHVGDAAHRLQQLLATRGQTLALAVNVTMPGNSFLSTPQEEQQRLEKQEENVLAILPQIRNRERQDYTPTASLAVTPVGYPNNFRGIRADENCVGCGICTQVCPMGNITLLDGKAVIGDDCATCLACFHWCPKEAIWMSRQEEISRRRKYRHPDVTLSDIKCR